MYLFDTLCFSRKMLNLSMYVVILSLTPFPFPSTLHNCLAPVELHFSIPISFSCFLPKSTPSIHARHNLLIQGREASQVVTWAFVSTRVVVKVPSDMLATVKSSTSSQETKRGHSLLMILLSIPPLPCLKYLRNHLSLPPLLIHLPRHLLGNRLLPLIMPKNPTPILSPPIRALLITSSRIMHFIKKLNQFPIANLLRVKNNLQSLRMARRAGANSAVGGRRCVSADVAHARVVETS